MSEFLPSLLKGCVQLGIYPELDTGIPLLPVDWVCSAICAELLGTPSEGRDLHLIPAEPISFAYAFRRLKAIGHPLEGLPFDRWKAAVFGCAPSELRSCALFDFLTFLEPLTEPHFRLPNIRYDNTMQLWSALPCVSADQLLEEHLEFLAERGGLPALSVRKHSAV